MDVFTRLGYPEEYLNDRLLHIIILIASLFHLYHFSNAHFNVLNRSHWLRKGKNI